MDIDKETLSEIITNWYKNEEQYDWLESWNVLDITFNEETNELKIKGLVKCKIGKKACDSVILSYEKDLSEDANENDYIVNLYHLKGWGDGVESKKTIKGIIKNNTLYFERE